MAYPRIETTQDCLSCHQNVIVHFSPDEHVRLKIPDEMIYADTVREFIRLKYPSLSWICAGRIADEVGK